jgi:hypothetical protein
MSKFTTIPDVALVNLPDWENRTLSAVKENVDKMLGLDGSTLDRVALQKSFAQYNVGLPTITAITEVTFPTINYVALTADDSSVQNMVRWEGGWASIPSTLSQLAVDSDLDAMKQDLANLRAAIESITAQFGGT